MSVTIANDTTGPDENQSLREYAAQDVERVAVTLENLATRLRWTALQFKTDRPAAEVVADIVNDYTQGIGQTGTIFWSIIRELSRMR